MPRHSRGTIQRRNNFDAIRLFAAFAVVVQHVTAHLNVTLLWVEPYSPWWFYDGVPLFFMISGLFVYRSAARMRDINAGWGTFYQNRVLRVLPAIWAYLVVTIVVLLAIGAVHLSDVIGVQGLAWILSTLLLAPVYSPDFLEEFGVGAINGSLWTIPAEVSFYVIVPLLALAATAISRKWFIPLLLVAGLMLATVPIVASGLAIDVYEVTFLPYLWYFGIGMGWHHVLQRGFSPSAGWAAVGLGGYIVLTALGHALGDVGSFLKLLAALPLSLAVIWVGQDGPKILHSVTRRLGDISFGVYVWHMPLVNLLLWAGFGGSVAAGFGAIAATVMMGLLSWHLVEKRALALKRATSREGCPSRIAEPGASALVGRPASALNADV